MDEGRFTSANVSFERNDDWFLIIVPHVDLFNTTVINKFCFQFLIKLKSVIKIKNQRLPHKVFVDQVFEYNIQND